MKKHIFLNKQNYVLYLFEIIKYINFNLCNVYYLANKKKGEGLPDNTALFIFHLYSVDSRPY